MKLSLLLYFPFATTILKALDGCPFSALNDFFFVFCLLFSPPGDDDDDNDNLFCGWSALLSTFTIAK